MEWIEIFKAIILGVIEGITEWLPVSQYGAYDISRRVFTVRYVRCL